MFKKGGAGQHDDGQIATWSGGNPGEHGDRPAGGRTVTDILSSLSRITCADERAVHAEKQVHPKSPSSESLLFMLRKCLF